MGLIKRGIDLGRTIKNVGRLREILSVFAKNGLQEFITKTGLSKFLPPSVRPAPFPFVEGDDFIRVVARRLRASFEELGPSFVKFGQLVSTREDLFPAPLIEELKGLQNRVKPIPFDVALKSIQKELEQDHGEIFASIRPECIGSASIGVVYRARMHSGEDVVIKIKRPGIGPRIEADLEILAFLVEKIEKYFHDLRYLGLSRIVQDFKDTLIKELNFHLESRNCQRLADNLALIDTEEIFVLPKVYDQFTTKNLIVMSFLDGKPFNEIKSADELSNQVLDRLQTSTRLFLQTLLRDGFFHADLHGGNFYLLPNDQIGLLDFGLMGHLSKRNRTSLIAILHALMTNNYENLVYEFLEIAEYDEIPNIDSLVAQVRSTLSPYVGLSAQQTDMASLMNGLIGVLAQNRLHLPSEWPVIFRALITLDGVGKSVGLDFNVYDALEKDLRGVMEGLLSKDALLEEAIYLGRDALGAMRTLPRYFRWFAKERARSRFALTVVPKGLNRPFGLVARAVQGLTFALVGVVFVVLGDQSLGQAEIQELRDIPHLTWIYWALALMHFGASWVLFLRTDTSEK